MKENKQNPYIIPGSIIIAGLFIAGAVMYSPGQDFRQIAQPGALPGDNVPAPIAAEDVDIDIKGWPSKGDPNAPILIVEYSDFACSFCVKFSQETLPAIKEAYIDIGKVRFVYKDFIVVGGYREAEAAHCAGEQGKFWEYHDVLFERFNEDRGERRTNIDIYREYAQEIGLNMGDFTACFDERRYQEKVRGSTQEGRANGVTGTPAFFVNGRLVSGALPFSDFQQIIDQELANL